MKKTRVRWRWLKTNRARNIFYFGQSQNWGKLKFYREWVKQILCSSLKYAHVIKAIAWVSYSAALYKIRLMNFTAGVIYVIGRGGIVNLAGDK